MNGEYIALVIDDEVLVRNYVSYVLQEIHLNVILSSNVYDAWRFYQEHEKDIVLVYMDAWTPFLNGKTLYHQLRAKNSEIAILYSLSNDESGSMKIVRDAHSYFLNKPFSPAMLMDKASMAVERYENREPTPCSSSSSHSSQLDK